MLAQATAYCAAGEEWGPEVGLYFHVYGHNSVDALHLHVLDLDCTGRCTRDVCR